MNAEHTEPTVIAKSETKQGRRILKRVGTILFWLILWPALLLAVTVAAASVFTASQSDTANAVVDPIAARFIYFSVIVGLVVTCVVISFVLRRFKRTFLNRGASVLRGYMWVGMFLAALVFAASPELSGGADNQGIDVQPSSVLVPTLEHDPKLVTVLQTIGAKDIDLIDQRYVAGYSDPAFPEKWGEYQAYVNSTTSAFAYGMLTIKQGLDPEQEKVSVAHEYLHHVWFKLLDAKTKDSLTAQLIGMYGNDPAIRQRVKEYVDAGNLYPTELFSYYCTESSDGFLTGYVLEQCNKYINRGALTMTR